MNLDVKYLSISADHNGGFVARYGSNEWFAKGLYSLGQLIAQLPRQTLVVTPGFCGNFDPKDADIVNGLRDKILRGVFRELSAEEISRIEERVKRLEHSLLAPNHGAPARHPTP